MFPQDLLTLALLALAVSAPLWLDRYLRQLPVAPSCPSCRGVARQVEQAFSFAFLLPSLGRTFIAECGRCGWKGRMRWRWATRTASDRDR